jgi:hypothetical protein
MAYPLKKVISGGQTGADQGGLKAAKGLGIQTGGYAPKGWRTLDGPNPGLGSEYGLVEHFSPDYKLRTAMNVFKSDGTVRLAADFNSPGEICTLRAISEYRKPYYDINILDGVGTEDCADWIKRNGILVLNIAGNAERTCPGIYEYTVDFLTGVFLDLGIGS